MFGIKVIIGAIAASMAICNLALGQIIIAPDAAANCTGDFVADRCSNDCLRPSCFDLVSGPFACPMFCTEMCVCKEGLVYDDCVGDCRLPDDCSPPDQLEACAFPDESDGSDAGADGTAPANNGDDGPVAGPSNGAVTKASDATEPSVASADA